MKPISISEKLMFITMRLVSSNGSGTGYFYDFEVDDKIVPVIITNKHVVNNNRNETMQFFLHLSDGNGGSDESFQVTLSTEWYFHPRQDLCFCFAKPVFDLVKQQTGKEVFLFAIDDSMVPSNKELEELSVLEELVMVGYPIGMWDYKNNFPIFRKGYTAAHPAIDFNEDGVGLVDMACFPGSSGSPIFILNEGSYRKKDGSFVMGPIRMFFVGTLFAAPVFNITGDLVVRNIPTQQKKIEPHTSIMINLGYYIKSLELDEFRHIIRHIMAGPQNP